MKNLLALSALALATGALAAPKISAQSIIVNPIQTDLDVRVWTGKGPNGREVVDYRVGENIKIFTSVNQDAYVYLFNVNPDGSIDQILPNRFSDGNNFLKANTVKQFPPQGANYNFSITGPDGLNKVLALASKTPLNLDQISQFKADQQGQGGFATVTVRGQENLAQALSIVVTPLPQTAWTADTVLYNTVGAAPAIRYGSARIGSNVSNANVYLNGRLVGPTGSTLTNLQPGKYSVRVSAPGYTDFNGTIVVNPGQTANLNAQLQEQRLNLQVRSNVERATVFVNGRNMGDIRDGDLTVNLPRGTYEVVLVAPGYRANVQTVQLQNSGPISMNLVKAP